MPYALPTTPAAAISANPNPICTITCSVLFPYTGDTYTWTVPTGVNSIQITLAGAQGGNSGSSSGGKGGVDTGTASIAPGTTIYVVVGGQNGFNGGGAAGVTISGYTAGSGGGATDVRVGGSSLNNRLMVAGGGGGAGRNTCSYQTGGAGGYPGGLGGLGDGRLGDSGTATAGGSVRGTSTDSAGLGSCSSSGWGGGGGGQRGGGGGGGYGTSTGGTNGSCGTANNHVNSTASTAALASQGGCFGFGGNGGNYNLNGNGGGGGGGYYGGGAGGGNWGTGGGGGSSFIDSVTAATYANGVQSGNGYALIVYSLPSPTTIAISDALNGKAVYRAADLITAVLTGSNGKVKFYANGKAIGGCQSVQSSGLVATCNWSPSARGSVTLYAVLVPLPGYTSSISANLTVSVSNRTGLR